MPTISTDTGFVKPGSTATIDNGYSDPWEETFWAQLCEENEFTQWAANSDLLTYSNGLYAYNFGFNIPSTATITGVEARERAWSDLASQYMYGWLMSGTASYLSASPYTDFLNNDNTWYIETQGGPNFLWNATLTPAVVNATNFGLQIAFNGGQYVSEGATYRVSCVELKIYYSYELNNTTRTLLGVGL